MTRLDMRPGTHGTVHDLFLARCRATPAAAAVVAEGRVVSYGDLDAFAETVADGVRAHGIGLDQTVALLLPRSIELIAAILGVHRAGAAYVPLDPQYPDERLRFILDDAKPRCVVTLGSLAGRVPNASNLVLVGDQRPVTAAPPTARLSTHGSPDSLAYVVHTSGTTGRPKGVLVTHAGLLNHAGAIAEAYGLGPSDRVLQFSSITFDVAAEEIFPTLAAGACLVLRNEESTGSLADFLAFLDRNRVTVANLPAPYWHELVIEMGRSGLKLPASLRLMIVGSERVLPQRLAEWWRLAPPSVRWINAYGPTETTITATLYEPERDADLSGCTSVPIGKPIAGVTAHVLDAMKAPVDQGKAGELWIGGAGVARGYLGLPELTAECFVRDPFSSHPGGRLYRTGDLVRVRADGNLEFLGRADSQVKLRGFRIELGEIEAALARHPDVDAAAACLREDVPGKSHIAGYVVPRPGTAPTSADLRAHVKSLLPDYMVPGVVVLLDALPLLASGKTDRRALPVPDLGAIRGRDVTPPRTPTEQVVGKLWSALLGVDPIGIHDDFFELGGHSLLATRLVAELRDAAGVHLSVVDVFGHPTLEKLAARVEASRFDGGAAEVPPITRLPRPEFVPLGFSQEPVWFLNQIEPGLLAYNTQLTVRFRGPLCIETLRRTFDEIIRRHEIFRTTFESNGGQPFQAIHPPYQVDVPLIDLRGLGDAQAREAEAERRIDAELRRTFDVTKLPLVRWSVFQLAADDFVLAQSEHHFVHDGWSIARLLGEIADIYRGLRRGEARPLPELPVQYADFVLWQRSWIRGPALDRLLAFWSRQLAGMPALLNVPTDRPRPKFQTFTGASRFLDVPDDLYDRIRAFSRREGVTPFMTMMAAFLTLLHRYTSQSDLPVGSTVANRRLSELEPLIGMVVNPIVIRGDVSGNPSFRDLVQRVKRTALDAYAHQDLPFERIVQALRPDRDPAFNPIFQVMFSFHDAPVPDIDLGDVKGSIEYRYNGSAKFDWNVIVLARREQRVGRAHHDADERVTIEWEYNTDLFDEATIARVQSHYVRLLGEVVASPEAPVSCARVMSPEERADIVGRWNRTRKEFPQDVCLHDLVARRAEQSPSAPAVVAADGTLTYSDLMSRARALAAVLADHGVGRGGVVGVCLGRSVDLPVALLGVLESGGAYLPMDPAQPRSRLEFMAADAGVTVILTEQSLRDRVPAGNATVLCVDALQLTAPPQPQPQPRAASSPEDLAYVIYTSGSTGQPKGVEIPHRALVNFMTCMDGVSGMTPADTLLAVTTISFDIAGLEIFLPLCVGARVHLATREDVVDSRRLADLITASKATVMQATPATWRMLVDIGWGGAPGLRILCGGEALSAALAAELHKRARFVLNLYGPTETTIWSAAYRVTGGEDVVPIGEPIANTELHVLDAQLEPVPFGVAGDLFIGGAGLARGYRGRPDLTQDRFVANPFGGLGSRLYRTGDLVRRRADGQLVFLGRLDHQVKIRGFRIELGEIEAALRTHPRVRDAVVLAVEKSADDRRLVAWFVRDRAQPPQEKELREFLGTILPEYMIPSSFVAMDAFPLSPSGKVDRGALPAPRFGDVSPAAKDAPAFSPTEALIATIWGDLLGVRPTNRRDNFFDLGGHSLLVMKALARVQTETGVRLGPRDMMLQNLGQVAAIVDERRPAVGALSRVGGRSDREPPAKLDA